MSLLKKYIANLVSEIKKSDFENLISRPDMQSSHPVFTGSYKDKDHFVKFPSNEIQTLNEFLAYKIYSLYDVKIPDSFDIVFDDDDGVLGISTATFSGEIYKGRKAGHNLRNKFNLDIGSMFYVDAFLANWDTAKNVLVNFDKFKRQGEFDYRMIDPGGALNFRAKGERKGKMFTDDVGELDTLLNRKLTRGTGASYVYGGRDDALAQEKFKAVSWPEIESMIMETCSEVSDELEENNRQDLAAEFNKECELVKNKLKLRYNYIIGRL